MSVFEPSLFTECLLRITSERQKQSSPALQTRDTFQPIPRHLELRNCSKLPVWKIKKGKLETEHLKSSTFAVLSLDGGSCLFTQLIPVPPESRRMHLIPIISKFYSSATVNRILASF